MITQGGEVSFVSRIFTASKKLRKSVRWFSSLLGKKESVDKIQNFMSKSYLKGVIIKTSSFRLGKTTRWILAWTFMSKEEDLFPIEAIERELNEKPYKKRKIADY